MTFEIYFPDIGILKPSNFVSASQLWIHKTWLGQAKSSCKTYCKMLMCCGVAHAVSNQNWSHVVQTIFLSGIVLSTHFRFISYIFEFKGSLYAGFWLDKLVLVLKNPSVHNPVALSIVMYQVY